MIKKTSLSFFFIIYFSFSWSQSETSQWYFGNKAGLSFLTNPPVPLANSAMWVIEGSASMSDAAGNLLFYTDGETVWDKSHSQMANGFGLFGNFSSSQSSIIVKRPASSTIYYIITVQGFGGNAGLNYSEVNMNLAAGLGSVTAKNVPLYSGACTEQLGATRHCNGQDVWLVSHELNSNKFRSFLITSSGINSSPVISNSGTIKTNYVGSFKFPVNGVKIAAATINLKTIELFDFSNITGNVSNPIIIDSAFYSYSCEFSPDGSKLYYAGTDSLTLTYGKLKQVDLCSVGSTSTSFSIYSSTTTVQYMGLQLAMDGKIYAAASGSYLAVIQAPDQLGQLCNFVSNGQSLAPNSGYIGLPNIMASLYDFQRPFTYTIGLAPACNSVSFTTPFLAASNCLTAGNAVLSQVWSFDDPSTGTKNTSIQSSPLHVFSNPGTYQVKLLVYFPCRTDTFIQSVLISSLSPSYSILGPLKICVNESAILSGSDPSYSYTWSGFETTNSIVISPTVTNVYTVIATNTLSGCKLEKTIQVTVNKCLGLNESNNENTSVFFYPNPSNGTFGFMFPNFDCQISIYNSYGTRILIISSHERRQEIDLREMPDGIYTAEIKTLDCIKIQKLIKLSN